MGGKNSAKAEAAAAADESTSDDPLGQDEVNRIIRENLTRLKHGDLFMEGLGQECYGNLIGGGKMTTNLSKFISIVAAAMVKFEGTDGSAIKKRKKMYVKVLKLQREIVEDQIRAFEGESDGAAPEASPSGEAPQQDEQGDSAKPVSASEIKNTAVKAEPEKAAVHEEDEELRSNDGIDDDEEEGLDEDTTHDGSKSSSRKRLKKKRKHKEKGKKRKHKEKKRPKKEKKKRPRKELDSDSDGEKEKEREKKKRPKKDLDSDSDGDAASEAAALDNKMNGARATSAGRGGAQYLEAKEKFEREKQKTLDGIPKDIKARFRQLCFSHWSKQWLPALELGPYDVAPGPVRDQWFQMYKNVKKSKRPLTRLVYWYGTPRDEMGSAYSFQPSKSVISYEEGVQRSHNILSPKVQKKVDTKKKLTKTEAHLQRALEEIQSEVDVDPKDRLKWTKSFEEEYEYLAGAAPLQDDAKVDDPLEDDKMMESADESSRKSKKKRKRKKGGGADGGKSSKKLKKKRKSKELDDEDIEDEESGSKRSKKGKKRRKKEKEPKEKKVEPKVEMKEDVDVMNEDIPSDEDKDDDFREDVGSDSDNELHMEESTTKTKDKTKAVLQKKRNVAMTDEEKEKAHQEHLARRRERDRLRRLEKKKEKDSNCPLAQEQRLFEECERLFLPTMSRLEKAINSTDADLAEACLNELSENIDTITPPFVRSHGIGMAIKRTRKALKESSTIKALCHSLTNELKRVYLEKDKHVPDDFEPKKSGEKEVANETEQSSSDDAKPAVRKDSAKAKAEDVCNVKTEPPQSPKKVKEEPPRSPVRPKEEPSSPRRLKEEKSLPDQSVPKKSSSSSAPNNQPAQTDAPKAPAPAAKPARKSGFSLKGMFEKPKATPKAADRVPSSDRAASAAKAAKAAVKKELPTWLTTSVSNGREALSEEYRNIALEFLSDAAHQFPEREINTDATARALESAVFDYSQFIAKIKTEGSSADRGMEVYWEKVHDISASIAAGKQRGQGSLYKDILDGVYLSAAEVVKLKKKSLLPSLGVLAA